MRKRRWGETGLCFLVALAILAFFSPIAVAQVTSSFHGYLESNFVVRDVNGMQYGFFDEAYGVQQRNTLKFDVDVDPDMDLGPFRVEKVHLTFRGAYDSIFDLAAHRYNITEDLGASRFDYGEEDIRFESDLREAFIDVAYKGGMGNRAFIRAGRQIVSWGEGQLETLNDVINPPDQSYQMFFQNPDDVKTPLWMGRLNFDLPRFARTSINFDLLWVPDIRPTQLAPMDSVTGEPGGMESPYMSPLPYAFLGQKVQQAGTYFYSDTSTPFYTGGSPDAYLNFLDSMVPGTKAALLAPTTILNGATMRQDVPTNNNEYGGKVSAQIGDRFSLSLLYFRDVVNEGGMDIKWNEAILPGGAMPASIDSVTITHNKQHVYGGYFSYQMLLGRFEAVIRGEVSHYTKYPIASFNKAFTVNGVELSTMSPVWNGNEYQSNGDGTGISHAYVYKPVTKTMLAIDKDLRLKWISPHDLTRVTFEWLHTTINEWHGSDGLDQAQIGVLNADRENIREQDSFYLQVMTNWWASKLAPMVVVACTPGKHGEGTTWMLRPSIKWTITPNFYTEAVLQAFMGDDWASYGFGRFVKKASEASIKVGYEW
ncbi:MAG: hypothetical protein KKC46_16715 [Proteobacteria bacterium]|nr:hypothetical protein [Pseudomonadota bacterium]